MDVLKVIKEYAFVASPFPLILSLEDHLSIPQQQFVAKVVAAERRKKEERKIAPHSSRFASTAKH